MGQYFLSCNITKKEFLNPHVFQDGQKLIEFGTNSFGTMSGLAILLADGNGQGGGDIEEDPITGVVGRWAGDRIVIAGDYAEAGRFVTQKDVKDLVNNKTKEPIPKDQINLYDLAKERYKDISYDVLFALMMNSFIRESIKSNEITILDFKKIHNQLAKDQNDMALLIGQLKTEAGKSILERFLKGKKKK